MSPVEIDVVVQDVTESKPTKPKVSSLREFLGTDITVIEEDGQEYEIEDADGMSYADGKISATKPGTAKVRTRIAAVAGKSTASAWSNYTTVTFTRQTQTIITGNQSRWSLGH